MNRNDETGLSGPAPAVRAKRMIDRQLPVQIAGNFEREPVCDAIASSTRRRKPLSHKELPGSCHSHSIINEPSKLLICNAHDAAPQKFTVIFTVKVRSTSIGAGLRAIQPDVTFRDLSTSIDSDDDR